MGKTKEILISFCLLMVRPQVEKCWTKLQVRCKQAEVNARNSNTNILRKQTDLWQRLWEKRVLSVEKQKKSRGMRRVNLCVKMLEKWVILACEVFLKSFQISRKKSNSKGISDQASCQASVKNLIKLTSYWSWSKSHLCAKTRWFLKSFLAYEKV